MCSLRNAWLLVVALVLIPVILATYFLSIVCGQIDGPVGREAVKRCRPSLIRATRLAVVGFVLMIVFPFQGLWFVMGEEFRFDVILPYCPSLLQHLHPDEPEFFLSWVLVAAIWHIALLIHYLWDKLAEQYDNSGLSPRIIARGSIVATILVATLAILILIDCLGAKSAFSHVVSGMLLALLVTGVNIAFICWNKMNGKPIGTFLLHMLAVDLPSFMAFALMLFFCRRIDGIAGEAFVSGCTAINLLMFGIAFNLLIVFEAYQAAKKGLRAEPSMVPSMPVASNSIA